MQRIDQDFDQRRVPTMLERSLSSYAVSLNRSSTWRNIQASRREAAGAPPEQQPSALPSISHQAEEGSTKAEDKCEDLPKDDKQKAQDPSENSSEEGACWTKIGIICEELPLPVTSHETDESNTKEKNACTGNVLPAISVEEDKKYNGNNSSQSMVLVKEGSCDNSASSEILHKHVISTNSNAVETSEKETVRVCMDKNRKTHLDSRSDKTENRETESLPDTENSRKEKRSAATTIEAMISVQNESVVWGSEEGEEERTKRKRRMMDDSEEDDLDIKSLGTVNPDKVMSNPMVLTKTAASVRSDTESQNDDECAKTTNCVKDKLVRTRIGHIKGSIPVGEKSGKYASGELVVSIL